MRSSERFKASTASKGLKFYLVIHSSSTISIQGPFFWVVFFLFHFVFVCFFFVVVVVCWYNTCRTYWCM